MTAPVVVLYHHPCPDGVYAALAARLCFSRTPVTFLPFAYPAGLRPDQVARLSPASHVYLLDVAGSRPLLEHLCARVAEVKVLDHHESGRAWLQAWAAEPAGRPPNLWVAPCDPDVSGAVMAWNFFLGEAAKCAYPDLWTVFLHVQDHDLWKHRLRDSRAFAAGWASRRLELDPRRNPDLWRTLTDLRVADCLGAGRELVRRADFAARAVARHAVPVVLAGQECLAVATTRWSLRSQIGAILARRSPSGVGVVCLPGQNADAWSVSLRASGSGACCLAVAESFGGGGNPGAAGCTVPRALVPQVRLAGDHPGRRGCGQPFQGLLAGQPVPPGQ